MLQEKLKSWDYYYDKMPLFFKNDENIVEQFRILFDLLVQLDITEDKLIKCFDVMQPTYLSDITALLNITDDSQFDFLDKLASLYGVDRYFDVTINGQIKHLALNNNELLLLIKARIIQMNYDGTYLMAKKFYEDTGLQVALFDADIPGEAKAYLVMRAGYNYSQNVIDMFKAGLFIIRSLGISYQYDVAQNVDIIFVWYDIQSSEITESTRFWGDPSQSIEAGLWL